MMSKTLLGLSAAIFVLTGLSMGAKADTSAVKSDVVAGKRAFSARCASCHSMDPTAKKLGPHLQDVMNRKAASVKGFGYSSALKKSGLIFDRPTLDAYLANPRKTVPGTSMMIGVPDAKTRAYITAYLASQS